MTTVPSSEWPRSFLLDIYAQAVQHGMVMIEPITEANAKSLAGRLYRLRRRSDKGMAHLILPEYHLVTVGEWRPGPDGQGQLPIIYNRLPSDEPLPDIRPATDAEAGAPFSPATQHTLPLTAEALLENLDNLDLTLEPEEVDSFVDDLMAKAVERSRRSK